MKIKVTHTINVSRKRFNRYIKDLKDGFLIGCLCKNCGACSILFKKVATLGDCPHNHYSKKYLISKIDKILKENK